MGISSSNATVQRRDGFDLDYEKSDSIVFSEGYARPRGESEEGKE
jgi:hypothetical protein